MNKREKVGIRASRNRVIVGREGERKRELTKKSLSRDCDNEDKYGMTIKYFKEKRNA